MKQKTIALLGGTTPESTVAYYLYFTREYIKRYGDFGFPEILIHSVNFQQFMEWAQAAEWAKAADKMVEVFDRLKGAGADFGLMTANTPHIIFDEVASRTALPLLSIINVTVEAVREAKAKCIGLLGTTTTMDSPMYPEALKAHGITTLVPEREDRVLLSHIIYKELSAGILKDESRREYLRVIGELEERGAQGIILGCTEIPLLVKQEDAPIQMFDTTSIHAERALQIATGQADL